MGRWLCPKCNPRVVIAIGTPFRFPAGAGTLTAMSPRTRLPTRLKGVLAVLGAFLLGCRNAGRLLEEMLRERPPAPLDSMSVASDVRIDSLGYLVGSFVGEGTTRAVHLLSSDTGFVAALVRRYRPDLVGDGEPWQVLTRERVLTFTPAGSRRTRSGAPRIDRALAGGPTGHTAVTPTVIRVHGSPCGWRGAQAEIIVEDDRSPGDPALRGPVLGSFTRRGSSESYNEAGFRPRDPLPEPGASLVDELVGRTARTMDSALAVEFRSLRLQPAENGELEINTLADVDAADVIPFRTSPAKIRFAVSLRQRRVTAGGDTVLAATVMVWDSAGAWQQGIFRPTLVSLRRGRIVPYGTLQRSFFWRRLQPISDFGFQRDNLWMEQVDVRTGSVLWGIIQPRGNVVVAAAEVEGSCR
jgi:hypothetical protein